MTTSVIKFYPKRELSQQQLQRIGSHKSTVNQTSTGELVVSVNTIITPDGNLKPVQYKTVAPNVTERVVSISDVPELFTDLKHINVILTNACNLSCTYCYEQHDTDFGRFTPETLMSIYSFLLTANDGDGKRFQFFGGEPLIHKKLILQFLDTYASELEQQSKFQRVSMITNGILLTPDFIDQYFQHKFVNMSISLDTDDARVDHREIGQDKIDHIFNMIDLIPSYHKSNHMVSIRCTISVENSALIPQFADRLYRAGIRMMVIHPLTMSSVDGFIQWSSDKWNQLHSDIAHLISSYPDFNVQFSEGVGVKGGGNCMVGSDMIAVDGSGDYSGCYFFTNQKQSASHAILGNLLHRTVYADRYVGFQDAYNMMFAEEEQCKTCDLQGFCYQCPAGNLDSGDGRMFRPDSMCQDIVRLFLDLQQDIVKKTVIEKFSDIMRTVQTKGVANTFKRALAHLIYYQSNGHHVDNSVVDGLLGDLPSYQSLLTTLVEYSTDTLPAVSANFDNVNFPSTPTSMQDAYHTLMTIRGKSIEASSKVPANDVAKEAFYLTLIHMLILNKKGDTVESKHKKYVAG